MAHALGLAFFECYKTRVHIGTGSERLRDVRAVLVGHDDVDADIVDARAEHGLAGLLIALTLCLRLLRKHAPAGQVAASGERDGDGQPPGVRRLVSLALASIPDARLNSPVRRVRRAMRPDGCCEVLVTTDAAGLPVFVAVHEVQGDHGGCRAEPLHKRETRCR